MDIFGDLTAEQDRLEAILDALDDDAWTTESGAPGWTIADVVLHLAQSEEAVVATVSRRGSGPSSFAAPGRLDDVMDARVRAERAEPAVVFARWRAARRAAVDALRGADPKLPVQWAAAPLKPPTLATTRLAEHWAHGLDVTEPLGVPFPDTDRLRHVAWLGHGSLPYAFRLAGQEPHEVHCELVAPDGSTWAYGPPDADSTISGPAGAFCRVGAQRLVPEDSGLVTTGPHGRAALGVLRNYAG
ncbi:MAG TPA: maleylpyruvate isomerase family mycothiol-dependent enzyme [Acidimicrobiia bacterium]|nr:maleylpyruvate isomerase family mycothiol-dependent enzyme [Acidimicrobiia bacterium]